MYICIWVLQSPERVVVSLNKTSKYEIMKNKLDTGVKKIVLKVKPVNDTSRVFTSVAANLFWGFNDTAGHGGVCIRYVCPDLLRHVDMGLGAWAWWAWYLCLGDCLT